MFETKEEDRIEKLYNAVSASISNQKKIIELLNAQSQLISQSTSLKDSILEQSDTIKKQHESLMRYQNDIIYKTQKGLILELIGIADNIVAMLSVQRDRQDYDKLLEDVNALGTWVDKCLETVSVRSFSDVEHNREFNPKRQEMKENIITDNAEEDGKLVSLQKGYIWSTPWLIINSDTQLHNYLKDNPEAQTFQFVIRPELVAKKKVETSKHSNND